MWKSDLFIYIFQTERARSPMFTCVNAITLTKEQTTVELLQFPTLGNSQMGCIGCFQKLTHDICPGCAVQSKVSIAARMSGRVVATDVAMWVSLVAEHHTYVVNPARHVE